MCLFRMFSHERWQTLSHSVSLNNCFGSWQHSQAAYTRLQLIIIDIFVNAYVLTKPDDETGRCGELCSSGMEGVGCGKQRPVVTALRKALEHLKRNRMKWIDSFLR